MPHHPDSQDEMPQNAFWVYQLSFELYNFSHSVLVFFGVFFLSWILFRKPHLELFGWLVHIVVDIPTHTLGHFPTPFLWPLSEWKFSGIASWEISWFTPVIYLLLFFLLYLLRTKKRKEPQKAM